MLFRIKPQYITRFRFQPQRFPGQAFPFSPAFADRAGFPGRIEGERPARLACDFNPSNFAMVPFRAREERSPRAKGSEFGILVLRPVGEESQNAGVALEHALVDDQREGEILEPYAHGRHEIEGNVVRVASMDHSLCL